MAARFFVDENDLALGKALAELHDGIVFPGHVELPEVPRQTLDDDWLRVIGQARLVGHHPRPTHPLSARREAEMGRPRGARLRADRNDEPVDGPEPRPSQQPLGSDQRHRGIRCGRSVDVRHHPSGASEHRLA